MANAGRRVAWIAVRALLSAALVAVVLSRIGSEALLDAVRRGMDRGIFLAASVVIPPLQGYAIGVQRMRTLLRAQDIAVERGVIFRAMLVGTFFNQLLPTAVGGDAYQVWYLGRHAQRVSRVLSVIFLGRVLGVVAMCLLAAFGILMHPAWLREVPALRWLLPLFLSLPLVVVLALRWVAPSTGEPPAGRFGIRRRWHTMAGVFSRYRDDPGAIVRATLYSLVLQAEIVFHYWCFSWALGLDFPFVRCMVAVPVVTLATMLPISLNGLGIREWVMIWISAPLGIATADAAMIAWLFVLSGILYGFVGAGVFWISRHPKS